jgi:hypothetical protein
LLSALCGGYSSDLNALFRQKFLAGLRAAKERSDPTFNALQDLRTCQVDTFSKISPLYRRLPRESPRQLLGQLIDILIGEQQSLEASYFCANGMGSTRERAMGVESIAKNFISNSIGSIAHDVGVWELSSPALSVLVSERV